MWRKFDSLVVAVGLGVAATFVGRSADVPRVHNIELQPLAAQVARLQGALDYLGAPLTAAERTKLADAAKSSDAARATTQIQEVLDPRCLFGLTISPAMRLNVYRGPAAAELVEQK